MRSYLENKYNEKFLVKNIRKEGAGFAVSGWTAAEGSPVNNSVVVFKITDIDGKKGDDYIGAIWQYKNKSKIEQMVRDAFGDIKIKHTDIHIGVSEKVEYLHNTLKDKDLRSVLKSNPEYSGLTINIETVHNRCSDKYRNSLSRLARHLYDFGFRDIILVHDSPSEGLEDKGIRCILSLDGTKRGGFEDSLKYRCAGR